MKLNYIFLSLFIFSITNVFSQDTIQLKNPSFDQGAAISNKIPPGWKNCGRGYETPPDIHSSKTKHYEVKHEPRHGKNFLGLVVRSNFTKESISQKLEKPLRKGKVYAMSFFACKAKNFQSHDSTTSKPASFNQPAIVRIWAVEKDCSTRELIFESNPIHNLEWKKITFEFSPKDTHEYILIESFFDKMIDEPYNGHVLLDGFSEILEVKK